MKSTLILLAAVLLGFTGPVVTQTASGMQSMQTGQGMHGMDMHTQRKVLA